MNKAARRIQIRKHLTYANVMVTLLTVIVLGGATAYAALKIPRNSIGTRQLQAKSVTNGKLANNAVTGAKVAEGSLTGTNINLSALGTVPQAANASLAAEAKKLGGHAASCPEHTLLIRGLCFDSSSNPQAPSLNAAAASCASKGGWLPTPMELYTVKGQLNLGSGSGTEKQFTDSLYGEVSQGNLGFTAVIYGAGQIERQEVNQPAQYYCVYPLVR
jgi:hypothetical protein